MEKGEGRETEGDHYMVQKVKVMEESLRRHVVPCHLEGSSGDMEWGVCIPGLNCFF